MRTVGLVPHFATLNLALRKQLGHDCSLLELEVTSDVYRRYLYCVWLSEPVVVCGTLMCGILKTKLVKPYDIIACHLHVGANACQRFKQAKEEAHRVFLP